MWAVEHVSKSFFLSDLKKVTTGDLMKINQRSAGDQGSRAIAYIVRSGIFRAVWHISCPVVECFSVVQRVFIRIESERFS